MAAGAADDVPRRALRLGFAGTPQFAVPAMEALSASVHPLVAVYTQPDRPAGRGRQLQMSPVKSRALELGLPVHQPVSFSQAGARAQLEAMALDALVVAAYGLILPRAALDVPRLGCFNIHASLLPRWRGAAPIQRAILAGDRDSGICIMRMEDKLDTGSLLARRVVAIAPQDTAGTLHDRLAALGAELIGATLDELAAGRARETAQPCEGITYADKVTKAEALIDWREDAERILRKVRAFNPTPVAETRWQGHQLRIWEASCGRAPSAQAMPGTVLAAGALGIEVACGGGGRDGDGDGGGSLRIERLQLAGRKPLTAAQFLRSADLTGARFAGP